MYLPRSLFVLVFLLWRFGKWLWSSICPQGPLQASHGTLPRQWDRKMPLWDWNWHLDWRAFWFQRGPPGDHPDLCWLPARPLCLQRKAGRDKRCQSSSATEGIGHVSGGKVEQVPVLGQLGHQIPIWHKGHHVQTQKGTFTYIMQEFVNGTHLLFSASARVTIP